MWHWGLGTGGGAREGGHLGPREYCPVAYLIYHSQPSWEGGKARSGLNSPQFTDMYTNGQGQCDTTHGGPTQATHFRGLQCNHAEKARAHTGENREGTLGTT